MASGHYSDELLVAYLDGEMPAREREDIASHLRGCWRCRTRAADIESVIGHISRTFAEADVACLGSENDPGGRLNGVLAEPSPMPARGGRPQGRGLLLLGTGALAVAAYTTFVAIQPRPPSTAAPAEHVRAAWKAVAPAPPAAVIRPQPSVPATVPPSLAPPPVVPAVDAEELEIEVRYALHRLEADVTDNSLMVKAEDGHVVIRGIVGSAERRQRLESALSQVSWPDGVRTELRVPDEIAQVPSAPGEHETMPAAHPAAPFAAEVRAHAGGTPQAMEAGNQAVALVERMTDLGWALRRLDERYDPVARSRIPPRGRWLIEAMEIDYLEEIRDVNSRLASDLAFLLPDASVPGDGEGAAPPQALPEQISGLRDLTEWLFAARDMASAPPSFAAARAALRDAMKALDNAVELRLGNVRDER